MIYTTPERNNAILLIAAGKASFENVAFYERLESFNWIVITRLKGVIHTVELSYTGNDLYKRLIKNGS